MQAIVSLGFSLITIIGGGLLLAALAILGFRWLFGGWSGEP